MIVGTIKYSNGITIPYFGKVSDVPKGAGLIQWTKRLNNFT